MNGEKLYNFLGICKKAGQLASGAFQTEEAIQKKKALLVLIPEDASDNTKKKFQDKCAFYQIPIYLVGEKEKYGKALGKEERTSIAVLEAGFAKKILAYLSE